jgi:hypothetical protein
LSRGGGHEGCRRQPAANVAGVIRRVQPTARQRRGLTDKKFRKGDKCIIAVVGYAKRRYSLRNWGHDPNRA